ncbi:MAG: hypothetical protein ACODAC_04500 [Pseudomonadota bacterium]
MSESAALLDGWLAAEGPLLLYGGMGTGKSTLAAALGRALERRGRRVSCIGADPGTPAFGVPGAACRAVWRQGRWQCLDVEPLCTLDAARFRLPLVRAVARLTQRAGGGLLMVDAPGVVRGVASAELFHGLADAAGAVVAGVLVRPHERAPLESELDAWQGAVFRLRAHAAAARPGRAGRAAWRTQLWRRYLGAGVRHDWPLSALALAGTPPPVSAEAAWPGRQVAAFRRGRFLGMGEVERLAGGYLHVRMRAGLALAAAPDALLVRDAIRDPAGWLVTAAPAGRGSRTPAPAASPPEGVTARAGKVSLNLVNGVFGDPLVALRVANLRHSVLFDLGDAEPLALRHLHRVRDVFVSHTHLDHIGGFPKLLRAALSGDGAAFRIFGPAGLCGHVAAFIDGFRWDRIGDAGPVFEVAEIHPGALHRERIQPGRGREILGTQPVADGVVMAGPEFTVHAAALDHRIPVMAYALRLPDESRVHVARLRAAGYAPGPWLSELKALVAAGREEATVTPPGGRPEPVSVLRAAFVDEVPGCKVVYATDLADHASNRRALVELARNADLLICEATFRNRDRARARSTQHLTTRACAEIALSANVARLLPMHFSRRYTHDVDGVYHELADVCRGTPLADAVIRAGR